MVDIAACSAGLSMACAGELTGCEAKLQLTMSLGSRVGLGVYIKFLYIVVDYTIIIYYSIL